MTGSYLPCLICLFLFFFFFCCSFVLDGNRVEASRRIFLNPNASEPSIARKEYRTTYHFQPPSHWINDPNGPLYYKGFYHLFYQYNPKGPAQRGNKVWGHSVSKDMINWQALEPAIYPSKPFDIKGCWSGSATILPGNKPVILYTGIDPNNRQVQNMAIPKDLNDPYLREWIKPDFNPVITPDTAINATAFRDPATAWFGPDGHWRIIIGSRRLSCRRGLAVLYRSKDFKTWVKAKQPLHSVYNSGMWECPDFFPVALTGTEGLDTSENGEGVKHVFKVSLDLTRFDYYTVGKYDISKDRYYPDSTSPDNRTGLRYDYGNFYASKTFFDPVQKRRILWGWSNESSTARDDIAKGWAGIQTIPRSMWLDSNGKQVVQWPIKEVEVLRGKAAQVSNTDVRSGEKVEVKGINTAHADVEVTFDLPSLEKAEPFDPSWTDPEMLCGLKGASVNGVVGPFGLMVLASEDVEERTGVFFSVFKAPSKHVFLMCHDSSKSSKRPGVWKQSFGAFVDFDIENEKTISLRSLIDNSVVESFGAGGRAVITSRVYPEIAVGVGSHLFAFNNGAEDVTIKTLNAWEMKKPLMNGVVVSS